MNSREGEHRDSKIWFERDLRKISSLVMENQWIESKEESKETFKT